MNTTNQTLDWVADARAEMRREATEKALARERVRDAAPDLLAALEMCREITERAFPRGLPIQQCTFCEEKDWETALKTARAAIAKAKGDA